MAYHERLPADEYLGLVNPHPGPRSRSISDASSETPSMLIRYIEAIELDPDLAHAAPEAAAFSAASIFCSPETRRWEREMWAFDPAVNVEESAVPRESFGNVVAKRMSEAVWELGRRAKYSLGSLWGRKDSAVPRRKEARKASDGSHDGRQRANTDVSVNEGQQRPDTRQSEAEGQTPLLNGSDALMSPAISLGSLVRESDTMLLPHERLNPSRQFIFDGTSYLIPDQDAEPWESSLYRAADPIARDFAPVEPAPPAYEEQSTEDQVALVQLSKSLEHAVDWAHFRGEFVDEQRDLRFTASDGVMMAMEDSDSGRTQDADAAQSLGWLSAWLHAEDVPKTQSDPAIVDSPEPVFEGVKSAPAEFI